MAPSIPSKAKRKETGRERKREEKEEEEEEERRAWFLLGVFWGGGSRVPPGGGHHLRGGVQGTGDGSGRARGRGGGGGGARRPRQEDKQARRGGEALLMAVIIAARAFIWLPNESHHRQGEKLSIAPALMNFFANCNQARPSQLAD